MGNTELKAAFKIALKGDLAGAIPGASTKLGLTAEILLEDQLVQSVDDYIKSKMQVAAELDMSKAFPDASGNIQTVENSDELYKRQLIAELNENYITGFATAESNIEFLKEPSFEKYFTVNSPDSIQEYSKLQQQKFVILYALYVEKYREQQDKKTNFFEYIQRFLDDQGEGADKSVSPRIQVGLESGFKFSLSLLKEIRNINKDMLVNSLEYLYQTLRYAEPGSLYSTDKLSFMIDSNLNDARSFLVSLIEEGLSKSGGNKRATELAFKILLLLGIVRSNVEDLLMAATLLDRLKDGVTVDLRIELEILLKEGMQAASQEDKIVQKKLPKFGDIKTTKNGTIFFLKAGMYKQEIKQKASFTCDGEGQYIYIHQEGLGLAKLGIGAQGQMIGQVFQHLPEYRNGEHVQILKLNNYIYVRSEALKPKPFVRLNASSLEEDGKEEFELDKEDRNLEWKENEETGRSLTYTPLISDGHYIYVISQRKAPKIINSENQDAKKVEEKPPLFVIEIYDPKTIEFKFVREVALYKNDDQEPFIKEKNSIDFLKNASFATNGQVFMIHGTKSVYFFDLNTGVQFQKGRVADFGGVDHSKCHITYDYMNNQFYGFKFGTADTKMESFTIANFKKGEVSSGFVKEYLQKRINTFKSFVYGQQDEFKEGPSQNPFQLNLIQRIMKNVTTPVLINHSQKESLAAVVPSDQQFNNYQKALILEYIYKACQNFETKIDEILSQKKSAAELEASMISFFKFPNATYLTHVVFQQIQENLDRTSSLIDSQKNSKNLADQYCFFLTLKILAANFKALSFCSIALQDIMDEVTYQKFLAAYRQCIVKIIEQGYVSDFEEGENTDECKNLWVEISSMCLDILSSSINLIYSDIKDVLVNLEESLRDSNKMKNAKQAENSSISLNYLAQPENAKKLLQGSTEDFKLINKVFEQCSVIRSFNVIQSIKNSPLGTVSPVIISNSLSNASIKLLKNLSEQLIVYYCSLSESIAAKSQVATSQNTEREERDRQRIKDLEVLISGFFELIAQEIINQLNAMRSGLGTDLEALAASKKEGNQSDPWDQIVEKYERFSTFMGQIFEFNSGFVQIVNLYIQTFGVFKLKTKLLPSICHASSAILREISHFNTLMKKYSEKVISFGGKKDRLKIFLDSFSRSLSWFVGQTAYKLIKVKKDEEKKEKEDGANNAKEETEKMHDLIIQSNLLSGGIENRHIHLFSAESQEQIEDLIKISQDNTLLELLKAKTGANEEDQLIQALIHSGKNQIVDKLIGYLQNFLETKRPFVPHARLGGLDGMRMSRAAFGVMIKFSDLTDTIQMIVDEIDLTWADLESDPQRDIKIKDLIKTLPYFESIQKSWESASKMRTWIIEKKKNLSERIQKEAENEFKKKREEAKKKKEIQPSKNGDSEAKKEESNKEDEAVDVEKIELIDTSSAPSTSTKAAQEEKQEEDGDQSGFTTAEKAIIQELSDKKYEAELENIFVKIIEKADFLVKLYVPAAYLYKDPSKKREGALLLIKEPSQNQDGDQQKSEFNWKDRLKSWRVMQTSKGAIKSYTERNKEIFDSSVTSILACLQTAISSKKIKNQVENVFLNACRRVAGLKLLGELLNYDLPQMHNFDLMSWFCGSLRGNKNPHVAHYLDDLKGCGIHLEELARDQFFRIMKGMVQKLKECKEEDEIKVIINCLKWKYLARDHIQLLQLEIFKVLHQGDGKADNKLKRAWGRAIKQEVVSTEKDKKLTKEVVDLFEQVFLLTAGRIVKPDIGANMKLKSKGTSVPTLEKAQSRIDENVSELLIGQAFDVMFKEFERYIKIMKSYKGVDWTVYVKMRNKERKNNESKKEYDDEKLFDEEEEDIPAEEKKEEAGPSTGTEEVKAEGEEENKVGDGVMQETTDQMEASEKPDGDNKKENKEDDIEEKEKQEAIKKQEERAEKEMKSIYKLYSESFLRRLLRLVEMFTSIATVSPYPLSMVQKVANPYQLETLLNVLILSSPRIKIIVLKIIQNLIKIAIPFEVFEETITYISKDPKSQAYEILNKVVPQVKLEESKFLKFLYNYLLSIRHKMWTKSGIESEGQYGVTQEISEIFRIALQTRQLIIPEDNFDVNPELLRRASSYERFNFKPILEKKIKNVLENVNELNFEEVDAWLSFLPSCDYKGLRAGQWVLTQPPSNQKVILLGYSTNYIRDSQFDLAKKEDIQKMSLTMKFQEKSKAICMFQDKGIFEIIEADPATLTPIDNLNTNDEHDLSFLDDKFIMQTMISTLVKPLPKHYESLSYLERVKINHIKSQIIKIFDFLIKTQGQKFVDLMMENGIFKQFLDYLFQKSSKPKKSEDKKIQLTSELLEAKCYLLRQRALESRESLGQEKGLITGFVQEKKYIAFKGIMSGVLSLPISGIINHQAIIRSPILRCDYINNVVDLRYNAPELVIIPPSYFSKKVEPKDLYHTMRVILNAKITVTSDQVLAKDIFLMMRHTEKAHPRGEFSGLSERVVILIDKEDFEIVMNPGSIEFPDNNINQNDSTMDVLCKLLTNWGNCSEEMVDFLRNSGITNPIKIQETLAKTLDPDSFKEMINADRIKNHLEEVGQDEELKIDTSSGNGLFGSKSGSSELEISQSVYLSPKDQSAEKDHIKPADIYSNIAVKTRIEELIDKNLMKLDDAPKNLMNRRIGITYDKIYEEVQKLQGPVLLKEYSQTVESFTVLKTRETFINLVQNADLDKILPQILSNRSNQDKFAAFLKISYNEAKKQGSANSKQSLVLLRNLINNLFKKGQEGNQRCADFMHYFFNQHIIQSGLQCLQAVETQDDGKKSYYLKNMFFNEEEQAFNFGNPSLFLYTSKLLMKENKDFILQHPAELCDISTLSLAFALHLAPFSTKLCEKFLQLTLEVAYFTLDNIKIISLVTVENLLKNTFLLQTCESLKNEKSNNKCTEPQRLLTEVYVCLIKIKDKANEIKTANSHLSHKMRSNKYFDSMRRMDKIVRESEQGRFDYLIYQDFYKTECKDLIKLMAVPVKTRPVDKMFETAFKTVYRMKQCKKMKVVLTGRSKLLPQTELAISSDPECQDIIEIIQADDSRIRDTEFQIFSQEVYFHYPYRRPNLYGYGSQNKGRLGSGKNSNDFLPLTNIPISYKIQVKQIFARSSFSAILDQNNQVHIAGKIKDCSERTKFTHLSLPQEVNLELIAVGQSSILVMGQDQKFYWFGRNKNKNFADNDKASDKFIAMESACEPRLLKGKIIQISSGSYCTQFVSDQGELFIRGKTLLDFINLPVLQTATLMPFPDGIFVKKAYTSLGGKRGDYREFCVSMVEVIDKSSGKQRKILSAGKNKFGVLAQGESVKDSNMFREIKVNFGMTQLSHIEMTSQCAIAVTSDGQLFSWGKSDELILGHPEDQVWLPKQVEAFSKYKVKSFSLAKTHSLVYANKMSKSGKEQDQSVLFSVGKHHSDRYKQLYDAEQLKECKTQFGPFVIAKFDDAKIKQIATGSQYTFIYSESPKEITELCMHKVGNEGQYEEGIMHFYKDQNGKLVFVPPSEYAAKATSLPDICFAIKYPIKKIDETKLPDLKELLSQLLPLEDGALAIHDGIKCTLTNEVIVGPRYYGRPPASRSKREFNFSDSSFQKVNECDIDPIIFLRFARSLPNPTSIEIPFIDPLDFYPVKDKCMIEFEIKPDYKSEVCPELIEMGQNQEFEKRKNIMQQFGKDKLKMIKEYINGLNLQSEDKYVEEAFKKILTTRSSYNALDIKSEANIEKIIDTRFLPILLQSEQSLKLLQTIYQQQSKYFQRFMNTVSQRRMVGDSIQEKIGWNKYMNFVKNEIFTQARKKIINKMISNLPTNGSEPSVRIKRRQAFYFFNSGNVDHEGKSTIFGQIFQQLRRDNFVSFKKNGVDQKVFNVTIAGEGAQDGGGPFRDCITNMCQEIQSYALPLFIKSQNNKNNHGQFRECWIPNSASRSPTHIELFTFFGVMLGWALRTTSSLQLDFPPIFWKKIIGQEVNEWDLKSIDTYTWQMISGLKKYLKKPADDGKGGDGVMKLDSITEFEEYDESQGERYSAEEFYATVDQKFVVILSNGTEIELCRDGRQKQVTLENLEEFISLVIQARLSEFDLQIKYIIEGIKQILPENILFFMTWQELEMRATGSKSLDIEVLKSITQYSGGFDEKHEIVQMFWNVMKTLSEEEKTLYLKFVWGRSRLPMNLKELSKKHTLEFYKSRAKDSLPIAHTCFFTLDLPVYSSQAVMKQKLIISIMYCGDIDADRSAHSIDAEE